MQRDYGLAASVGNLHDDALVGPHEIAALLGLAVVTVQQKKVRGLPAPIQNVRHLKWRLGDVRDWMRGGAVASKRGPGRPRKAAVLVGK